jgi:GT2 family glycosyltransferase
MANKNVIVSFIIVNYNGEKTLRKCLKSVVNQDFAKEKMEIIVVDNNSSDKSERIVKKFKGVKLIKNKRNVGFCKGNNIGIKVSKGSFIALINNDAVLEKKWCGKMIEKISGDEKIGVLGCRINYGDSEEIWAAGAEIIFPGFAKHLKLNEEKEVDYVAFAAALIRKSSLKNGGFDEKFFMYGEDAEMCKRIRLKGFRVVLYPRAIARHYVEKNRVSANEEYYINRNRAYYYTKFYSMPLKILYFIADILLFFNIFLIYRIFREPRRIKFFNKIIKSRIDSISLMLK